MTVTQTAKQDAKGLYYEFHTEKLKREGNLKLHDIKARVEQQWEAGYNVSIRDKYKLLADRLGMLEGKATKQQILDVKMELDFPSGEVNFSD